MPRSFAAIPARLTWKNRLSRITWNLVQATLYRYSPTVFHGWRCFLLRRFGAAVKRGAHPYPKAKIWAPWNLTMEAYSCIADDVDCYCVAPISIGAYATVSQYSYLCSAGHDYREASLPLVVAPIVIEAEVWVAADVFVGPGVRIGHGAIVGARSTVMGDVEPWSVVAGPAATPCGRRPAFSRAVSEQ